MSEQSRRRLAAQIIDQVEELRDNRIHAICSHPLHRDLSLPQLHILIQLSERGSMMVSELANLFQISPPSASAMLDRMEERGLVERIRDHEDRRVVRVQATERGRSTAEDFVGPKRDQMSRLLAVMSDAQLRDFNRGIAAVRQALAVLDGDEVQSQAS